MPVWLTMGSANMACLFTADQVELSNQRIIKHPAIVESGNSARASVDPFRRYGVWLAQYGTCRDGGRPG